MKKRLLLVLAMVVAMSLIAAAPVSARGPNHGHQPPSEDQVIVLNQNPDMSFGLYGCEEISWFGTIVIDGKTFGMALHPDYGYFDDSGVYHYGEWWKIFTGKFEARDDMLKRCEPGTVVMAGYDVGTVSFAAGTLESFGTVDSATGYFKWWDGYDVRQDGQMGLVSVAGIEDAVGFNGFFETY